jgi:putative ABC transport system permease protein
MRWITMIRLHVRSLLNRSRADEEIDEELRYHVERQADELVARGMDAVEARYAALRMMGGVDQQREHCRDALGFRFADEAGRDLGHALRSLVRHRTFTAVTVLTLAVGSGANAAIFSIFNQALLRPLPVPAPAQLVNLSSPGPKTGRTSTSSTFRAEDVFSYPLFRDLEREQRVFTGIAAHRDFVANVVYRGQASHEEGELVSGRYFPVLALRPALGRLLGPEDDRTRGAHPVVVLSHSYWQRRFNADPAVINDRLMVNGQILAIVGVAPPDFAGTTLENQPRIFVPMSMAALMMPGLRNPHTGGVWNGFDDRRDHWLYLFARLKPGIPLAAAERTINVPFAAIINDVELPLQGTLLSRPARERFKARRLFLEPGIQGQRPEREELRGVLLLLFSVSGIVLLITCANIANLLLARAASRERDITIQLSLGAGRGRLVRQMLTESVVLAAGGSVAGLIAARWTLGAIAALVQQQDAAMLRFELDRSVLLFAILLAVGMALLFGLYPALLATRRDLAGALRGGSAGTHSAARLRTWLATAQVALSLALLVIAGLFAESLRNVTRVDLGMMAGAVTTFRVSPELNGYAPAQSDLLFDRINQQVTALPGVTSIGVSTIPVLAGVRSGSNVTVEGFVADADTDTSSYSARIGPGYFKTLGVQLLAGREFTAADVAGAARVAIINEAFARKFNIATAPIGKRMRPGAGRPPDIEIVGLVRDARYSQPKDAPVAQFFFPYRQGDSAGTLNFYVRSMEPPASVIPRLRVALTEIDSSVPVENLRPLADQADATATLDRLITMLASGFAVLAMLLAGVGLYGVLSYNLAQRTRELGLHMALGATVARVRRMVFLQVSRITIVGGIAGAIAALALGRIAESMLFQVPGYDILVLVAATAAVIVVALGAGAIPAWRASRIDPMQALRCE